MAALNHTMLDPSLFFTPNKIRMTTTKREKNEKIQKPNWIVN